MHQPQSLTVAYFQGHLSLLFYYNHATHFGCGEKTISFPVRGWLKDPFNSTDIYQHTFSDIGFSSYAKLECYSTTHSYGSRLSGKGFFLLSLNTTFRQNSKRRTQQDGFEIWHLMKLQRWRERVWVDLKNTLEPRIPASGRLIWIWKSKGASHIKRSKLNWHERTFNHSEGAETWHCEQLQAAKRRR